MICVDNVDKINSRLSDTNPGARRRRPMKDHILIVHGVINSIMKDSDESIDIQVCNLEKAFDEMWMEDCYNDVFDNLPGQKQK